MPAISCLVDIVLDDSNLPPASAETEQERNIAIFDMLEENVFGLPNDKSPDGPYKLTLSIIDRRVVFDLKTQNGDAAGQFHLSISPMRQIIKDYFAICESYFKAVTSLPPSKIEAIDMGRRGIHDEGASQLLERLDGKIDTDHKTARRLFTLICALQFKG